MVPIGPSPSFVGVFHGRLAVFLDQRVMNAGKHTGHVVEVFHRVARARTSLVTDFA